MSVTHTRIYPTDVEAKRYLVHDPDNLPTLRVGYVQDATYATREWAGTQLR